MSWAFRKRLLNFFRASLWVVPALSTLAAFLSVPLLRLLDKRMGYQFLRYTDDGPRAGEARQMLGLLCDIGGKNEARFDVTDDPRPNE